MWLRAGIFALFPYNSKQENVSFFGHFLTFEKRHYVLSDHFPSCCFFKFPYFCLVVNQLIIPDVEADYTTYKQLKWNICINLHFVSMMRTKTNKATTTASFWLSSLRKQPTFHDAITPRDITFEEWLQKFHTDDASLPRYGYCLWLVENLLSLIRSTTQIWIAMETCYQLSSVWNFCASSSNVVSRGNQAVMGSRNFFF